MQVLTSKDIKTRLSYNVAKHRKQKNITQQELADMLGLKRAAVGSYEEGRAEPTLSTILKLCSLFDISIEQLIDQPKSNIENKIADLERRILFLERNNL